MILEEENMILKMRRLRKMYKKFLYKEQSWQLMTLVNRRSQLEA
jgi:hypothetical protein